MCYCRQLNGGQSVEWLMEGDEARPVVGITVLRPLALCEIVGWMRWRESGPWKRVPLVPKEQIEAETKEELASMVYVVTAVTVEVMAVFSTLLCWQQEWHPWYEMLPWLQKLTLMSLIWSVADSFFFFRLLIQSTKRNCTRRTAIAEATRYNRPYLHTIATHNWTNIRSISAVVSTDVISGTIWRTLSLAKSTSCSCE